MGESPTKSTLLVVSDSLGDTACDVALAASAQFDRDMFRIVRLAKIDDASRVRSYLEPRLRDGKRIAVFHTVVDCKLREEICSILNELEVPSFDIMGPAIDALAQLSGMTPKGIPGIIHQTDDSYFNRIEAMEYFVEHDDGRGADDLSDADIVLLGISRTSKTPLSMYLAFLGYKVANIPLAPGMEPPSSVFEVDPAKIFGLLSTVDVIAGIRDRRLGDQMTKAVAGSYSDPVEIEREMREARSLMGRLGCIVIRTDKKAIEESAAEIILHLETVRRARKKRARTPTEL
ncbi:MAG: pyruvate, water dikinase regulatory protein [Collinsella sp.]|nr:pyruvate, water dikinase regulatory protein [Collinsella sp.]